MSVGWKKEEVRRHQGIILAYTGSFATKDKTVYHVASHTPGDHENEWHGFGRPAGDCIPGVTPLPNPELVGNSIFLRRGELPFALYFHDRE
jgi:hypothetical protein